ncbi:MAG: IclR family transcriptional regulator [Burkholderiaceae bacterium]|nr:IclR family transcriptional regulator [Burkholderiaceae bacterium]
MHQDDIDKLQEGDAYFATTLAKGLLLLRAFAPSGGWLGNKILVERTGLTKPTVTRLAKTLTQLGYLRHSAERGKYCLDAAVLELVNPFLSQLAVRQVARPLMQSLADDVHGAVSLGVARATDMIFIESCVDIRAENARPDVGTTRPMATTAMGRAFLAAAGDARRLGLYEQLQRLAPDQWPAWRAVLEAERARYRRDGFTVSLGDNDRALHAVGVAIEVPGQDLPMAFNCVIAPGRLSSGQLEGDIGPRLAALARTVTTGITAD